MKGLIGKWAFVIGVLIAVLFGIFGQVDAVGQLAVPIVVILVILGLVIGLLNIKAKEATPFLLAGISLLIATSFGMNVFGTDAVSKLIVRVLQAILIIVVPAVIIVALREVFAMAQVKK